MENLENENLEQNLNRRDYDKEPIVIKNRIAYFIDIFALYFFCLVTFILAYFVFFLENNDRVIRDIFALVTGIYGIVKFVINVKNNIKI